MEKKVVATLGIVLIIMLSVATAYYGTAQDWFSNSTQSNQPQNTPTAEPSTQPTVTFTYSQSNVEYTDSTTVITLKIAFDAPEGYVIHAQGLSLISINAPNLDNGTKISAETINRSWSGYPLTIEFVLNGHYTGDYELRYTGSNATFVYNKVQSLP